MGKQTVACIGQTIYMQGPGQHNPSQNHDKGGQGVWPQETGQYIHSSHDETQQKPDNRKKSAHPLRTKRSTGSYRQNCQKTYSTSKISQPGPH
jgi:hypothetical protein